VAIAIPSFQDSIERNSLKQAIEGLKSDMQFARTQAIKKSRNILVTRSPGNAGTWCYGLSTKTTCTCSQATKTATDYCELKRVFGTELNMVNMNTTHHNNSNFSFRRGTIGAGRVTFSTNNYSARVIFSDVGRVRICTPIYSTRIAGYPICEIDS